jgi:hypothetical protein
LIANEQEIHLRVHNRLGKAAQFEARVTAITTDGAGTPPLPTPGWNVPWVGEDVRRREMPADGEHSLNMGRGSGPLDGSQLSAGPQTGVFHLNTIGGPNRFGVTLGDPAYNPSTRRLTVTVQVQRIDPPRNHTTSFECWLEGEGWSPGTAIPQVRQL